MGAQNRQIILFVDNCAAYPKYTSFLRNVKVVQYPANCTSTLQPLDLGIIHSLKAYYRKRLVQTSLCLVESGKEVQKKINVLEAMRYIMAAWQKVSQQTIQNCFRTSRMVMKWQVMMMISAKTRKNCVEPRNTISKATSQWIAMWQQVALKLLKNYVKHLILGVRRKKMKKMKINKRWCRALPRLTKLNKKLKRFSMCKVEATWTVKTF